MVDPEKSRQRVMAKLTGYSYLTHVLVLQSRPALLGFCVCITAVCMAAALGAVCCQSIYVF